MKELDKETTSYIHVFTSDKRRRIRRRCHYHKHLCYGEEVEYYDGFYITFDCGTRTDTEYWYPPPKKKCLKCRKWFRPLEMIKHLKSHRIADALEGVKNQRGRHKVYFTNLD